MNWRMTMLTLAAVAALVIVLQLNPGVPPNTIRWVTQSEEENFGYDVYRGPTEQGPFTRVNSRSILGYGTTDMPQRYEYRDTTVRAGERYWYYVESVSLTGERTRITPVYPSKPKSWSLW